MMSIESIRALSRKAAREAAANKKEPFYLEPEDLADLRARVDGTRESSGTLFPFPFIGSHRPKGWKLVKRLFVDTSGFGTDNEPALSVTRLAAALEAGYGYALVESGQFQGYLGVFRKINV